MNARRLLLHAAVLLAPVLAVAVPPAHADGWTADDVRAAMAMHSDLAACIVTREVGGVGFSPYAVGAAGELGPVQLAPFGLLPEYLDWSGGASPYDPYTALDYLDWALAHGRGPQWSTWWYCT